MLAILAALIVAGQAASFDSARGAANSPGAWRYIVDANGSESRFANLVALRCDRTTRRVRIVRLDRAADSAPVALTIGTDTTTRMIGADGWLAARDSLLDAIAFSRGRFVVDGGGPRRLVPAFPEAARSIEDCRN